MSFYLCVYFINTVQCFSQNKTPKVKSSELRKASLSSPPSYLHTQIPPQALQIANSHLKTKRKQIEPFPAPASTLTLASQMHIKLMNHLNIQIIRPHPRPITSQSLGVILLHQWFLKLSMCFNMLPELKTTISLYRPFSEQAQAPAEALERFRNQVAGERREGSKKK